MFLKFLFKLLIKCLFVGKAAVEVAMQDYKKARPDLDDAFDRAETEGQQAVDHLKRSWSRMEADLLEKADSLQKKVMHAAEEANGNGKGTYKASSRHENTSAQGTSNGADTVSSQASEVNRLQAELAELRVELRALRRLKRDETPDAQPDSQDQSS